MNAIALQFFSILGVLVYFLFIVYCLKRKSLSLKYTLTWIISGFCMGLVALFPQILSCISNVIGIETPVNALFAILLFFMILIMITLTSIVSRQGIKIKILIQENALLDKRLREMENFNNE